MVRTEAPCWFKPWIWQRPPYCSWWQIRARLVSPTWQANLDTFRNFSYRTC